MTKDKKEVPEAPTPEEPKEVKKKEDVFGVVKMPTETTVTGEVLKTEEAVFNRETEEVYSKTGILAKIANDLEYIRKAL